MRRLTVLVGFVFLVGALAMGCDSGDDGSTCSSVSKALCAKACECGGEGGCVFEGEGASLTFENQTDCEAFYGMACGMTESSDFDWGSCDLAMDEAVCGETGFITPPECQDEEDGTE